MKLIAIDSTLENLVDGLLGGNTKSFFSNMLGRIIDST